MASAIFRRNADRWLHRQDEFKKQIDEWICVFRNTKPASAAAGPLIPGDPEREAEAIRSKEGIPRLGTRRGCLLEIAKEDRDNV